MDYIFSDGCTLLSIIGFKMMESYVLRCLSELIESFLLQNHCYVLVFLTVLLSTRYFLGSQANLPPGPWGVPVLGYLPFLTKDIHVFMMDLSKKFGSIYRLNFGNKLLVILTDPKIIREAFRREEFTARPSNALYDIFDGYGECQILSVCPWLLLRFASCQDFNTTI